MAGKQANPLSSEAHPLPITHKSFLLSQIIVRSIAAITSLSATILMVTDKQSISLFGLPITAKYTYAPAFRFFTASNSIAFAYSVLSLTYLLLKKAQDNGGRGNGGIIRCNSNGMVGEIREPSYWVAPHLWHLQKLLLPCCFLSLPLIRILLRSLSPHPSLS
ncbi:CASP-like protein 1F1 isoform X2 [Amborella trichopoda]|uniref:CASP-like protein 1F1 isoform X2 n=1 Tax=Amborella trichopoda TaxID=13333 RepID=UPI0009BFAA6C|nr:CASP-like protein 1F1 isoform X2 [Amborella trichopoda]|eukprot:XP_020523068.1 CASP-like protein 1F1 isoform X2 [Amborella trichopoda]